MAELSVVWSSGKTPVQGCLPSVRGPKLPPMQWPPGGRESRMWLEGYLSSCALMIWELQAQRAGLFDLRAESVILTAWHTIARIHRGAA